MQRIKFLIMTRFKVIHKKRYVYKQIVDYLKQCNISQTRFARDINISRQQLNNIIRGREDASVSTLEKIGKAMGKILLFIDKD